jgi:hypothetical protein
VAVGCSELGDSIAAVIITCRRPTEPELSDSSARVFDARASKWRKPCQLPGLEVEQSVTTPQTENSDWDCKTNRPKQKRVQRCDELQSCESPNVQILPEHVLDAAMRSRQHLQRSPWLASRLRSPLLHPGGFCCSGSSCPIAFISCVIVRCWRPADSVFQKLVSLRSARVPTHILRRRRRLSHWGYPRRRASWRRSLWEAGFCAPALGARGFSIGGDGRLLTGMFGNRRTLATGP